MNFARSILDQFGGVRADPRAEKLSRAEREKLSTLRQRADNAMAANRQLGADRDELREALSRVELSLSILEGDGRSESNRASTNKVSIERCRTDIAKLKRELAQIEARRVKAVELSSATNLLVSNLETWLSALKGPAIAFLGSAEPKVLANESTADAIAFASSSPIGGKSMPLQFYRSRQKGQLCARSKSWRKEADRTSSIHSRSPMAMSPGRSIRTN